MTSLYEGEQTRGISHPISQCGYTFALRAVVTTEEFAVGLKPVSHDPDAAVRARRRQRMDRAFETVECMGLTAFDDLKGLVVVVAASFTCSHDVT
jgi:hypothetical protein